MTEIVAKKVLGVQLDVCHQIDLLAIGDVVIGGKPARNTVTIPQNDEVLDQELCTMLIAFLNCARSSKINAHDLVTGNYELVKKSS